MKNLRPFPASPGHCFALALAFATCAAHKQAWTPQRDVEIVATSAPAAGNDRAARQAEKAVIENRPVNGTVSVVNKPGGGNSAFSYVNPHPGDAHSLLAGASPLPGLARTATGRRGDRNRL